MRRVPAALVRGARTGARRTGPWPPGRSLLAAAAAVVAVSLALWTVGRGHALGGLLALLALAGLGVLAAALLRARGDVLGVSLALLGVPAALVAVDASAVAATTVGATLVAVLELSRWSAERRVHAPGRAPEWRRWLHLAAVLVGGWLAGVALVRLASGRLDLAAWQAAAGAMAALAVAAAVAVTARWRV